MLATRRQTYLVVSDAVVHTFNPPPMLSTHLFNAQPETGSGWGQQKDEQKKRITEYKTFGLRIRKDPGIVEHIFNPSTCKAEARRSLTV